MQGVSKDREGQLRAERKARYYRKLKNEMLQYYGPACRCCGEDDPRFLSLDHIGGGGNAHRRLVGSGGINMYIWLKARAWPEGFQVLCFNCNQAKNIYGKCPHQEPLE